jgi:Ca2+-binding RTX toxin-like protein
VTDQLPNQVDPVSAISTLGRCATQERKIVCNIGGLEFGQSAKSSSALVTVTVVVRSGGRITNTASVKADQKDPAQSNDKASVAVTGVKAKPAQRATCRGFAANVVGTPRADTLTGTVGRDVIAALGGSDTIVALSGRDLICAGRGNDVVTGGPGADRIFAGSGRDRVLGRGGPDLLKGLGGADVLKGNAGDDRLRGGSGFDTCRGGAGLDSLRSCERR